jgi:hypothetical protein
MGVFDDNPFITLGEPQTLTSAPGRRQPGEVVRGSYWALLRRDEGYVIDYVAGQLSGENRQCAISEAEAERLRATPEDALATTILIAHGEG